MCKIGFEQLYKTLLDFNFDIGNSFIIFAKNTEIVLDEIEKHLIITDAKFQVDYVSLINSLCVKGHSVVTKIEGSNGTSINIFYSKNI